MLFNNLDHHDKEVIMPQKRETMYSCYSIQLMWTPRIRSPHHIHLLNITGGMDHGKK